MYEEFYGLREPPFSLTPDPRFFFRSESHIRAYELLRYGLHRGEGFIVVYGDIGTGKTTLCRAVLENLPHTVISQAELDKNPRISKDDLIAHLNTFLLSLVSVGRRALLIIDEAQNIPVATLEQIRILSNLETHQQKLLQMASPRRFFTTEPFGLSIVTRTGRPD
ncbi:MAG TPA: AAA family ATPase [Terriglobia bacterium]